jgi:hypothetical protein
VNAGYQYLVKATTAQEAQKAIALGDAAIIYGKRIKAGQEASNQAAEFRLRAELRLGEILKAAPKNPGAKGIGPIAVPKRNSNQPATLASAGIDRKLAAR